MNNTYRIEYTGDEVLKLLQKIDELTKSMGLEIIDSADSATKPGIYAIEDEAIVFHSKYRQILLVSDYIEAAMGDYTLFQTLIDAESCSIKTRKYIDNVWTAWSTSGSFNISDGKGAGAIQQIFDGDSTLDFTGKNPALTADNVSTYFGTGADISKLPRGGVGNFATSLGGKSVAKGKRSTAEGTTTVAVGAYSHTEGDNTVALGSDSHAEGYQTSAEGGASHSEGGGTHAKGNHSHTEGGLTKTTSEADYGHAEGLSTEVSGKYAHSEGSSTKAQGIASHSEGQETVASGYASKAFGQGSKATATRSVAGGYNAEANGDTSFSFGFNTKTTNENEIALGKYNKSNSNTLFSIGIGNADGDGRANAFEVTTDGKVTIPLLQDYYTKSETYSKTEIDSKVSSVYKYKGTMPSAMLLPFNKEVGDVYNTTFAGYVYCVYDNNFTLTGISSSDGENININSEITLTFDKNISEVGKVAFVGTGADIAFWFNSNQFFIGKLISFSSNSIVVKMADLDITNTGYYKNPVLDSVQYIFSQFLSGGTTSIPIESIRYFAATEFDFRYEYIPKGGNVAYSGGAGGNNGWDSLGSTIDTSNFATKNELSNKVNVSDVYTKSEVDNKTSYATQSNKGTVRVWTTVEGNEIVLNIATED